MNANEIKKALERYIALYGKDICIADNIKVADILDLINQYEEIINKTKIKGVFKMLNKKVIIRAEKAGVFFGTLKEKEGNEVILTNCRRLWYWDGAASISQLATEGTTAPNKCKFTVWVDEIAILGVIEIIPCSDTAIKSIEGVKEWKR